jgi:hypothetical protein
MFLRPRFPTVTLSTTVLLDVSIHDRVAIRHIGAGSVRSNGQVGPLPNPCFILGGQTQRKRDRCEGSYATCNTAQRFVHGPASFLS